MPSIPAPASSWRRSLSATGRTGFAYTRSRAATRWDIPVCSGDCYSDLRCRSGGSLTPLHAPALGTIDDRVVRVDPNLIAALADHRVPGRGSRLPSAVASIDPVCLGTAPERIGSGAVSQVIHPGVTVEGVVILLAVQVVGSEVAVQRVVLRTAPQL